MTTNKGPYKSPFKTDTKTDEKMRYIDPNLLTDEFVKDETLKSSVDAFYKAYDAISGLKSINTIDLSESYNFIKQKTDEYNQLKREVDKLELATNSIHSKFSKNKEDFFMFNNWFINNFTDDETNESYIENSKEYLERKLDSIKNTSAILISNYQKVDRAKPDIFKISEGIESQLNALVRSSKRIKDIKARFSVINRKFERNGASSSKHVTKEMYKRQSIEKETNDSEKYWNVLQNTDIFGQFDHPVKASGTMGFSFGQSSVNKSDAKPLTLTRK